MGDKVLAFIDAYIKEHGYSPSFREIGEGVGVTSTSHVSYWVDKLVAMGKLTKAGGISRSVRVA